MLDRSSYAVLAKPSTRLPVSYYGHVTPHLFGTVLNQYMGTPASGGMPMAAMTGHDMHAKAED